MLRNYLLIAYRNLLRHKVFSLVNICGLAIGMAACLLILQYITFQYSYDSFHPNAPNLYRVVLGEEVPGRQVTPPALVPVLRQEFPQVDQAARLSRQQGAVKAGQTLFAEENMYWADAAFLNMFHFPLVQGDPATALAKPFTAVMSQSAAQKYFGDQNPVGQVVELSSPEEGSYSLQITGVLADLPQNSHLQFDWLLSYATPRGEEHETSWDWRNHSTYVSLTPGADPKGVEEALPKAVNHSAEAPKGFETFWLQPIRDIHLNPELQEAGATDPKMIYFLLMLAVFILLIAWVNYINLSTARSADRAKEVGVRKVMGANRPQLVRQFLLESLLLNGFGFFLAYTIVQLSLPYFRQLTGLELSLSLWSDWGFWARLGGLFLVGSFLSGLYPALVLSGFRPVAVLKGRVTGQAGSIPLREALVVFQFAASVALMAGTFALYRQMEHMRRQELGINIDQTLVLKGPQLRGDSASTANQALAFKAKLEGVPAIKSVTVSDALPSRGFDSYHSRVEVEGHPMDPDPSKRDMFGVAQVDANFLEAFELALLAGRGFSRDLATDALGYVVNEEALKRLGVDQIHEAVGKKLQVGKRRGTIIGVIQNYHHSSLKDAFVPTIFRLDSSQPKFFAVKINTGSNPQSQMKETLALVEQMWKEIYPTNPFGHFYLSESFQAQYLADQKLGSTVALFAVLAIFVACLGLFGLASFATSQRKKEVGVRKVLGASVPDILLLLNKDFIRLVLLANLLAWPLAWWGMRAWLQNYTFRIDLGLWLFLLPSGLVLLIALLTVSGQTWRAARANPVKSLRSE